MVGELFVKLTLVSGEQSASAPRFERDAVLEGSTLYVAKEAAASFNEVFSELSRLVGGGSKDSAVVEFLTSAAFSAMSGQDPENLLAKRGCEPLPDSVEPWKVS